MCCCSKQLSEAAQWNSSHHLLHFGVLYWLQIPLEKGYSQMEWMRLAKTHPDLLGNHTVLPT